MTGILRALETVGLGDVETAILKATYSDDLVPKAKHVVALVNISFEKPNHDFIFQLERRLSHSKWQVVLKTLVVVHTLSLDGHEAFVKRLLLKYPLLFGLSSFMDAGDADSVEYSRFVRLYTNYLGNKVPTFKGLGYYVERHTPAESKTWALALDIDAICKAFALFADQFDKLIRIHPFVRGGFVHPIEQAAMQLVIKDGFRLHCVLTVLTLAVLDKFQKMTAEQAQVCLTSVHHFSAHQFDQWCKDLAKVGLLMQDVLPSTKDSVPDTVEALLRDHLKTLEHKENKTSVVPAGDRKETPIGQPSSQNLGSAPTASQIKRPRKRTKPSGVAALRQLRIGPVQAKAEDSFNPRGGGGAPSELGQRPDAVEPAQSSADVHAALWRPAGGPAAASTVPTMDLLTWPSFFDANPITAREEKDDARVVATAQALGGGALSANDIDIETLFDPVAMFDPLATKSVVRVQQAQSAPIASAPDVKQ